MAHTFGATELPAAAGSLDPGLQKILAYLKAFVNAQLQSAWNSMGQFQPAIRTVHEWDPKEVEINGNELPTLFGYREQARGERMADDYDVQTSTLVLLWCPEPGTIDRRVGRVSFAQAVVKAVQNAFYREHYPGWVDSDDADPLKGSRGSNINDAAGLFKPLRFETANRADLVVTIDGGASIEYEALRITATMVELFEFDPTIDTAPAKIEVDISKPDEDIGDLLVGEFNDPTS